MSKCQKWPMSITPPLDTIIRSTFATYKLTDHNSLFILDTPIDRSDFTCNNCKKFFVIKYQCVVCIKYSLCTRCLEHGVSHDHILLRQDLDGSVSNIQPNYTSKSAKKLEIEYYLRTLVHMSNCTKEVCWILGCYRLKLCFTHWIQCRGNMSCKCAQCFEFLALCLTHSRFCRIKDCKVPTCTSTKVMLKSCRSCIPHIKNMYKRVDVSEKQRLMEEEEKKKCTK